MEKIKVTLVHSLIGESPKQKATAKALGLSKIGYNPEQRRFRFGKSKDSISPCQGGKCIINIH